MNVTLGTFNLNNLFSRYNFEGEIDAIKKTETSVASEIKYEFGQKDAYRIRSFKGRLVNAKKAVDTA